MPIVETGQKGGSVEIWGEKVGAGERFGVGEVVVI